MVKIAILILYLSFHKPQNTTTRANNTSNMCMSFSFTSVTLKPCLMSDLIIYNNISYILFDSKAAIIPAGEATFLEGDSASSCSPYR